MSDASALERVAQTEHERSNCPLTWEECSVDEEGCLAAARFAVRNLLDLVDLPNLVLELRAAYVIHQVGMSDDEEKERLREHFQRTETIREDAYFMATGLRRALLGKEEG